MSKEKETIKDDETTFEEYFEESETTIMKAKKPVKLWNCKKNKCEIPKILKTDVNIQNKQQNKIIKSKKNDDNNTNLDDNDDDSKDDKSNKK